MQASPASARPRLPRTGKHVCALAIAAAAVLATPTVFAAPIAFTTSQYTTLAQASVGAVADDPDFATSDASPLPLSSSAAVPDTGAGSASATASASEGLLAATSAAAPSSASAQGLGAATFFGDFVAPGGPFTLSLDLGTESDSGGVGGANLLFALFIDGLVVQEGVLFTAGLFETVFTADAGSAGALELTLTSESLASAGSTGSNRASVRFGIREGADVAVPTPATLALLALAGVLLPMRSRRLRGEARRRRAHAND
jgi:hypothetical protein